MGLDTVELIMEIEKRFDIKIPDQEAEKITTVGDMYYCVWAKLGGKYTDKCKSQILFYKLRKASENILNIPKQQFLLDSVPEDLFPKDNRREVYKQFGNSINLCLPDLELTRPWSIGLNAFGLIAILGTLMYAIIAVNFCDATKWLFLMPIIGVFGTILFSKILEPNRIMITQKTVRAFVENTLALNYGKLANEYGNNRKELEMVINQIIVDKIGVEFKELSPEKSFTDDLGVD
jgi:acyl carrier protein